MRPAFARYRDVLRDALLPAARPDDRCGLGWLDDGSELYQALIELHTGLALAPGDLHDVGMAEVTEALPAEYVECGRRGLATADLAEIFSRLVNDPGLRYRDGEEMLAHVTAGLQAAQAAMGDWFGTRAPGGVRGHAGARLPGRRCDPRLLLTARTRRQPAR